MSQGAAAATAPMAESRILRRTRWRLVAWSAGSSLIVLLVLGAALYLAIDRQLAVESEAQLRRRAEIITRLRPRLPVAQRTGETLPFDIMVAPEAAAPGFLFGGPASGTIAFVIGPDGVPLDFRDRIVDEGGTRDALRDFVIAGPDPVAVRQALVGGGETMRTSDILGVPVRVYTTALPAGGDEPRVLQIVADRTNEVRTLQVAVLVLVVGGLVALGAAAGLGWLYAGRALVPIRDSMRRQRDFAADASHELRTPLAVIRSNVEYLRDREGPAADPDEAEALGDVEVEVDRLTTLVDQLLLLARSDADAVELVMIPVDLAESAADTVDSMEPLAAERAISVSLDVDPVKVHGDPERLRQLVSLLLDNAIRHAREGGSCRVHVTRHDDAAVLTVEDDGAGIRPEDLSRVFDRFWRAADAPDGGSGLGLAIAAWIVERHDGRIKAENRPAGGARFRVVIPAIRPPPD